MWEDQYCSSDEVRVEVSAMPVVETARGLDHSHLLVGLTTGAPGTPARVTLNTDNLHQTTRHQPRPSSRPPTWPSPCSRYRRALGPRGGAGPHAYQALNPARQQRLAREAIRLMSEQAAQGRAI